MQYQANEALRSLGRATNSKEVYQKQFMPKEQAGERLLTQIDVLTSLDIDGEPAFDWLDQKLPKIIQQSYSSHDFDMFRQYLNKTKIQEALKQIADLLEYPDWEVPIANIMPYREGPTVRKIRILIHMLLIQANFSYIERDYRAAWHYLSFAQQCLNHYRQSHVYELQLLYVQESTYSLDLYISLLQEERPTPELEVFFEKSFEDIPNKNNFLNAMDDARFRIEKYISLETSKQQEEGLLKIFLKPYLSFYLKLNMQRYAQRYTFFVRNFEKPYTEQYYKHEMRLNQPVAFIYRITRELLIMDQGHHYGKVQITQYKQLYKKLEIVKAVQLYYEEKNDLPLSLNELTGIDPIDPFTGKAYNYRKGIRFFVLSSDRSDIPVGAGRHLQQSIFNFSIKY